jgi:hypothetical protein
MAITPENDLEKAMLAAATDDSVRPEFYRLLLASKLVALGTLAETMSLETVRGPAGEFHPVFTAPARVKALIRETVPSFTILGRTLFEIASGARFVLNPGSVPDKVLTADEIAWCLKTFPPAAELIVAQPKVYPTRLVKALCVLFTSRAAIRAAHLVFVAREGIDTKAHPMIGLEAEGGDVPRLAQEIFEAAAAVLPGEPVEVVYLDRNGPLEPLQKHLLSVPPFFERALPMN